MRNITLIAILFLFLSPLTGQIQDYQIKAPLPKDSTWVMLSNTNSISPKWGLGKWFQLNPLIDSLVGVYSGDLDWIKLGTVATVPSNTDSMFHNGTVSIGTTAAYTGMLNVIGRLDLRFGELLDYNIMIGRGTGNLSMTGDLNIGIGSLTLASVTTGQYNVAIGSNSAGSITSGSRNFALGANTMNEITTTNDNVGLGHASLSVYTGVGSLGVGSQTLVSSETGNYNSAIGFKAGFQSNTGALNTFLGAESGYTTDGSSNVMIGYQSGRSNSGSGNIFLGKESGENETGSNRLYIDNSNSATPLIGGDFAADTVRINGDLSIRDAVSGASTDSVMVWTPSNGRVKMRNASAFGGTTNLTIGGAGPTYTVESSTGTDVTVAGAGGITLSESPANTLVITQGAEVDGSITNELQTLATTSDATSNTTTLSNSGGSQKLVEGTGITLTTTGTGLDGIVTIANTGIITEVDGSITNELQTIANTSDATSHTQTLSNSGGSTQYIEGTGITITTGGTGLNGTATIATTALLTEVDGSITNEGSLTVAAGTGTTSIINSNTSGSTGVTITAGTGLSISEAGNVITLTNTVTDTDTDAQQISVTGASQPFTLDLDADATDATFTGAGITTVTRSTNALTFTSTEVDGSTTNELNVIEEGNVSVQTGNTNIDFQSMFDVATDGAGEVNISFDGGEATTVTTAQSDDFLLIHDSGAGTNEKMLWSDFSIDLISFYDGAVLQGTGNAVDVGSGLDISMVVAEANINLDASEFQIDGTAEGVEYVIIHDADTTAGHQIQRRLVSSFGGADGNGIYTGDGTSPSDVDVTLTDNIRFGNGAANDLFIDATNDRIGMGTGGPSYGLHVVNDAGMALEPAATGVNQILKIEGTADGGGGTTAQTTILMTYTDADYAAGVEQSALNMTVHKENDTGNQRTSAKVTMVENDDADMIVMEKNVDFSNTTESHIAFNAGVAWTQNYGASTGGVDLNLDRSYYTVNITGGNLTDTIKLPEVVSTLDNWTNTLTSTQAQVGQEYVISNLRSGVNLIIGAFNPAGTSDDLIGTRTPPGGAAGSAISIVPGKSVIIKCYQFASSLGYWNYWLSN